MVAAEDYYSVIDELKNDIIQDNSTAFSSIIEKYICLSHDLQPPDIDIERFYGGSRIQRKLLLKFLEQHKPDSSTSSSHIITSKSLRNHTPSDTLEEYSKQIQETLRKRKIQLGLPEDDQLYEVLDSDCDIESLEPNNQHRKNVCDTKMIYEKNEKRNYRQTGEMKCCIGKKSDGKVPWRMKIKGTIQTGIASCEQKGNASKDKAETASLQQKGNASKEKAETASLQQKGNASKDKAENASQEKEIDKPSQDKQEKVSQVMKKIDSEGFHKTRRKEIKHGNVKENSSQDKKEFDSEGVYKATDKKMLKKDLRVKLKRLDHIQIKFECDGPQPRIMKDRRSDELEVQKDDKEDEVNILYDKMDNVSQNKKASQVMKELCSKVTHKTRETRMILGNKEADASLDEKENASQNKKEILSEGVSKTTKKEIYEKDVLTALEMNKCSQRKFECDDAQPKFIKANTFPNAKKAQNNSAEVLNSALESAQVNTGRGRSTTHVEKDTGHKNDTNINKRELSDEVTKSHLMNDHSRTLKELVDVRPGNCTVVLTEAGDTIFIPPLAQHEKDNFISSMKKLSSKNNPPVFFVAFNVQDKEVSQPVRSPLNAAAAVTEPVMVESCQRESKVEVTPREKSNSCKDDKSIRKNIIMEEENKNSQNKKIDCMSPFDVATAETVTVESCQKESKAIALPKEKRYFSEGGKSKRKNTLMEETNENSQDKIDFVRLSRKCRIRCSQPEETHCLPSEEVKETVDTRRIGPKKNVSLAQDSLQALSVQKLSPARKGLENETSSSKTILCCQPKDVSCSQKEKTVFNERTPQSKSPSQNISHVKQQHMGLRGKKKWNEKTLITSSKRANERSEMIQISPSAAAHSILNGETFPRNSLSGESKSEISHTFCKETLSQSTKKRRKIILRRGLSVSKGRIVLEFFDRNAQKNKLFDILDENRSYDNEKKLSGEGVKDDTERHVEIDPPRVPNVKSTVSSNVGEICQEQCSIPNDGLDKGEAKDLNREWHIREEESIIAGIDAVKKKRKNISSGLPSVFGHPKDFVKSGQLEEQSCSVRSILPEVSSIVEDVTVPMVSSTRLEMPNGLPVHGVEKRKIPKFQNERNLRRKVDAFLCPVVAKKPKLDKSQQLLKKRSPERDSPACRRPNLVVSTNINNSGKQTDRDASKVKDDLGKYLVDSSRKKDLPSYHANYSDTDEELSLLPVEHTSTVVGPFCSSLCTISKLWTTLHNSQLQNTESERVKTGLHTMNSTVNSKINNTKVHKKSQSFWELDDDEEMKTYTQSLASGHKRSSTVMQQSVSCASQNSTSDLTAITNSIPSYRLLGGERWLAAIRSVKKRKKPFLIQSSSSLIKNKG